MIKQPLTPERTANIFQSVQFMQVMAELIKVEFQMHMDTDFKNPAVNQHASKIKQSAEAIQLHLSGIVKAKDPEFFKNEYTPEIYRVFRFFIGMDAEQIREFMDGVEEMQKQETKAA
jgi:hypothetical protein